MAGAGISTCEFQYHIAHLKELFWYSCFFCHEYNTSLNSEYTITYTNLLSEYLP